MPRTKKSHDKKKKANDNKKSFMKRRDHKVLVNEESKAKGVYFDSYSSDSE